MTIRLGEVLVNRNVLTHDQVELILDQQELTRRPFGLLAEQMFGIDPSDIEDAWAEQYRSLTGTFDLHAEPPAPKALRQISRRQAWQFAILPIRVTGDELVIATTTENLPRALRFGTRVLERPCYFVLTEADSLDEALARHYPMPGMSLADEPETETLASC